jgi:hypothetical protein
MSSGSRAASASASAFVSAWLFEQPGDPAQAIVRASGCAGSRSKPTASRPASTLLTAAEAISGSSTLCHGVMRNVPSPQACASRASPRSVAGSMRPSAGCAPTCQNPRVRCSWAPNRKLGSAGVRRHALTAGWLSLRSGPVMLAGKRFRNASMPHRASVSRRRVSCGSAKSRNVSIRAWTSAGTSTSLTAPAAQRCSVEGRPARPNANQAWASSGGIAQSQMSCE